MTWLYVFVFFSVVKSGQSINRPVYKAVLTQKGYAQFLQYDIETPPIREFTFCTWFRVYEMRGDGTIFTYVANGNNRVMRLWLDATGKYISVSINGKISSSSPVDIVKDTWRHVCLSYQSDYGAWAIYMDSRLISCQSSQTVNGFVLPGGGSVIVGYGTDMNGAQNGLEGEIFGANMILISTIERNYTIKINPTYEQKPFHRNRMKGGELRPNYVILNDLQSDEVNNNFETTHLPLITTTKKSFIKIKTPHSFVQHEVGLNSVTPKGTEVPFDTDFLYSSMFEKDKEGENGQNWNLNTETHNSKYRIHDKNNNSLKQSNPIQTMLPILPEHEVPPPVSESFYKVYDNAVDHNNKFNKKNLKPLNEVVLPPPVNKDTKTYGQWTSSKFAASVLNYLKNQQSHLREQKRIMTPQTIPLVKVSDSFPYASDFKVTKIRPQLQFQRRNFVERPSFDKKRTPQFNVQVLEDDLRNNIIKSHAQIMPKGIEISNRSLSRRRQEHRFYRNTNDEGGSRGSSDTVKQTKTRKKSKAEDVNLHVQNFMTILPFLKSLEYYVGDSSNTHSDVVSTANDVYTRSLSLGNKWHNVKSYSNDYTPREVKIGFDSNLNNVEEKIAQINKRHPAIRLKYKHENRKVVQYRDDESILKGRELAMKVSNQSDYNKDSVSILKYNHGFLPTKNGKMIDKISGKNKVSLLDSNQDLKNSFNKQVKIGNALNERPIIGDSVDENKKSFIGGDDRVPDINKYRSNTNNNQLFTSIPGSLGPRVCKNLELFDRVLYVQPDESIDMTHILSPVKMKNAGIEFITQNYKKCSLKESPMQGNTMLFIDWNNTPVRLFGGAYARRTTDLCGFF